MTTLLYCTDFEIDFPEAIRRKSKIIEKYPELKTVCESTSDDTLKTNKRLSVEEDETYGRLLYPDYALIPGDLRDMSTVSSLLAEASIDYTLPTLFLSECVLIYMSPEESSPVIEWSAKQFTGGSVFVCYEQIHPNDAFGRTMMQNLNVRKAARYILCHHQFDPLLIVTIVY